MWREVERLNGAEMEGLFRGWTGQVLSKES